MEEGKADTNHYATVTKDFVLSRDTRFLSKSPYVTCSGGYLRYCSHSRTTVNRQKTI